VTAPDHELIAISGWTDDDAPVLYAAAVLEELSLIELVERINELNQNKMLSIGAGAASNLLHEFWDKGYKRMPPKRRAALYAGLFGAPAEDGASAAPNDEFPGLFQALTAAIAGGSQDAVAQAAAAVRDNLAEHLDDATAKAATELRGTLAELAAVLSDMELRNAYRADDMWHLVERVQHEFGGAVDVQAVRTRAVAGARILHALPKLTESGGATDEDVVTAANAWTAAHAGEAA
jgi:hypothetical protein